MIALLVIGGGWLVASVVVALAVGRAIRIADERDGARGLRGDR